MYCVYVPGPTQGRTGTKQKWPAMIERKTVLKSLTLRNFRRFEEITLELDEKLTLLVAENGGGKTAMLDAIALALKLLVWKISAQRQTTFSKGDVRLVRAPDGSMVPQYPLGVHAEGTIDGGAWDWDLTWPGGSARGVEAQAQGDAIEKLLSGLREYATGKRQESPLLPVVAYYGTGRPWVPQRQKGRRKAGANLAVRTDAYLDCLSSVTEVRAFEDWFERVVLEAANERNSTTPSPHHPQSILAAVRGAVDHVLSPTGWKALDWTFLERQVVATHPEQGRLPISYLSDGVRNLLVMVGDLAHRAVRLNPHFREDACVRSPGIVLIDEVDLFLHPSWQQQVVGLLQEAFPQMQFILTSHSPQVISTVPRECVRVLSGNEWRMPSAQTRGVESALLLAEVMRVSSIPNVPESEWVSEYMRMIDLGQHQTEEAVALRQQIVGHFGKQHPVVLDCDRLIRWHAFKHRGSSAADG
jgi:predicted ATP-binding protein involved in virulence